MAVFQHITDHIFVQGVAPMLLGNSTLDHSKRVSHNVIRLVADMGITSDNLRGLEQAAILHDIGKIFIPRTITEKNSRLTEGEYKIIQSHTVLGHKFIRKLTSNVMVRNVVLYHNENFDGSGYPYGLAGECIPLEAHLVHVVDYFDALISERPYRAAYSITEARQIMRSNQRCFAPDIFEVFITLVSAKIER